MNKKSFLIIMLIIACIMLSGCNYVKGGTIDEIAGTYKLTRYDVTQIYDTHFNAIPSPETENHIEKYGMEVYVVLSRSGYGYYVYKDNDTAVRTREIQLNFQYDTENTELIESIKANDNSVGGSEMSFYVQSKAHTLTDNTNSWVMGNKIKIGQRYKIYKKFSRVSKAEDLSYVESQLGVTLTYPTYENNLFDGAIGFTEYYEEQPDDQGGYTYQTAESEYLYKYALLDAVTMKAKLYYALKVDSTPVETEPVDVTVDRANNTMQIGNDCYRLDAYTGYWSINKEDERTVNGVKYKVYENAFHYGTAEDMHTAINNILMPPPEE